MRLNRIWRTLSILGVPGLLAPSLGCSLFATPRPYDTRMPCPPEFRAPPDEERFNNPEEKDYKPPPPKAEFKPGFGGGVGGPSGGAGGMGGR